MSLFKVFDVAGSGMSAQTLRLNTIASNLANANNVSGDASKVYKARQPVFATMLDNVQEGQGAAGVQVLGVIEQQTPPIKSYEPGNPLANEQGFVFRPNISPVGEMANMISASRTFQNNVEVLNTTKQLLLATVRLGE
jgi:flagellar basal-body rod protein FlgC